MEQHNSSLSLWLVVWRSRLYMLLVSCFVFSLGISVILPVLPELATNYFASQHAGQQLHCEDYSIEEQPQACQWAHSDVVRWASLNSLVANTFLGFFFAPLVGDLSDRVGRKPFMLLGITLAVLPIGTVWLHLSYATSYLWYYPFNALTAVVAPIISFLSYTADTLRPELRTAGFGLVTASFSVGFMVGPYIGSALGATRSAMAAMGCMAAAFVLIAAGVPESYPRKHHYHQASRRGLASAPSGTAAAAAVLNPSPAAVATAASHRRHFLDVFQSFRRSWDLINSSSLFRRLALCMAVVGIVSEGIQDMLLQYLQLVMGFNTANQAVLITVIGAGNFVVQALLLPTLTMLLGERHLLIFGLLFSITEQALLSLAVSKWQAIAAVSLSSFAGVSFPAISSLKSTHASADQQGLVQGALAGIRAVASGLGPLGLAQLFAMSTTPDAALGYKPSIVFWTTCALTVVAVTVAASIPAAAAKLPTDCASATADDQAATAAGSSGAWLLEDEEDVEDGGSYKPGACYDQARKRHHQQHPDAAPLGPYDAPAVVSAKDVQGPAGGRPECSQPPHVEGLQQVVVVAESPASDDAESLSDQSSGRDISRSSSQEPREQLPAAGHIQPQQPQPQQQQLRAGGQHTQGEQAAPAADAGRSAQSAWTAGDEGAAGGGGGGYSIQQP